MKINMLLLSTIAALGIACNTASNSQTSVANSLNKPAAAVTSTPAAPASPTAAPASNLTSGNVSPEKPIAAAELNKAFFADQTAWIGKSVTVTGSYHSHTTSTNASGKSIRIDIADGSGKKVANCSVRVEPTKDEVAQRENRTFKGTVKEAYFNEVMLEPCEMVKQ